MTTPRFVRIDRSLSESIDELQRLAAEQAAREASTRAAGQATIEQVASLIHELLRVSMLVPALEERSPEIQTRYRVAARAVLLWAADADRATLDAAAAVAREEAGQ